MITCYKREYVVIVTFTNETLPRISQH